MLIMEKKKKKKIIAIECKMNFTLPPTLLVYINSSKKRRSTNLYMEW